jgi:hypothetical protein
MTAAIGALVAKPIRLFARLFSGTLPRQSLLHPSLLARLQVEGVTLHFLNNVFAYYLFLETTKGILQRLALLQSNFCQTYHPRPVLNHRRTKRCDLSLLLT